MPPAASSIKAFHNRPPIHKGRTMIWFFIALMILMSGGLLSLLLGRYPKAACRIGAATAVVAGLIVLAVSGMVLISGETIAHDSAWPLPFGSLGSLRTAMDPLSAVFAGVIAIVTALAAVFGSGYLQSYAGKKKLGSPWFFFQLLTAAMLLVVTARNGVLFLIVWEVMSLASFFLVLFEDEKESVRRAGWVYLAAMHLGTACLIAMFLLLGRNSNSLDFDQFSTLGAPAGVIFVLALIGFGTKAGFFPLHVWLPEAHPAAPSHVSAVMSGVMIKTGIYGILRVLTFLGDPPAWWGWTLIGVGLASAVLGVLYALAQQHVKRLLAYCSMENVGIIAMAMGIGLLGISYRNAVMTLLGFSAALLHVINHAVFKSLLFFGAGAILHATHTGSLDRLGGLMKRMPKTGLACAVGAAAICGLPPLNGFASEFLIYLGAMSGVGPTAGGSLATWPVFGIVVVGGLALVGGLAVACFTSFFGMAFLGEPRSEASATAVEPCRAMRWPMLAAAALCLLIGLTAPVWLELLQPAVAVACQEKHFFGAGAGEGEGMDAKLAGGAKSQKIVNPRLFKPQARIPSPSLLPTAQGSLSTTLYGVVFGSYVLFGFVVLLASVRRQLLGKRRVEQSGTWGCGYVRPTPRMEYTASSYVRPIVLLFRFFLQTRNVTHSPRGFFPKGGELRTTTPDVFRRWIYDPLFAFVVRAASKLRWLQEGRIQFYVLYIALTIFVLLIWKLRQ